METDSDCSTLVIKTTGAADQLDSGGPAPEGRGRSPHQVGVCVCVCVCVYELVSDQYIDRPIFAFFTCIG